MSVRSIRILHFNDVYHVQERKKEPLAGASRFKTALERHRNEIDPSSTFTLCSGDCFAPSVESTITRGKHWPPIYNTFGIDVACYGNHDFDFGVGQLVKLAQNCNFKWLLSNVVDVSSPARQEPVAKANRYVVLEKGGVRVGFIGMAEKEWLETIPDLPSTFIFLSFVDESRRLCKILKGDMGVDLVVALTHMRLPNDEALAKEVPEIDLILGGHDHFYRILKDDNDRVRIVKSGSDFMDLSVIDISVATKPTSSWLYTDRILHVNVERKEIGKGYEPSPDVNELVQKVSQMLSAKLSKILCKTCVAIDTRTETSRTMETNWGSFTADIMRIAYDADVAVLVGGTIRADRIYEPGDITMADIMDIYPYEDPIVVVSLSGEHLWKVLENGVSALPKQEGRFPQVSGIHFRYDSRREPLKRLVSVKILKRGESAVTSDDYADIDMKKKYTMATRGYVLQGNDGYEVMKSPDITVLVGLESGLMPSILLRRFFHGLSALRLIAESSDSSETSQERDKNITREARGKHRELIRRAMQSSESQSSLNVKREPLESKYIPEISPQTTGRIVDIGKK